MTDKITIVSNIRDREIDIEQFKNGKIEIFRVDYATKARTRMGFAFLDERSAREIIDALEPFAAPKPVEKFTQEQRESIESARVDFKENDWGRWKEYGPAEKSTERQKQIEFWRRALGNEGISPEDFDEEFAAEIERANRKPSLLEQFDALEAGDRFYVGDVKDPYFTFMKTGKRSFVRTTKGGEQRFYEDLLAPGNFRSWETSYGPLTKIGGN